jgi:hypothetical protein
MSSPWLKTQKIGRRMGRLKGESGDVGGGRVKGEGVGGWEVRGKGVERGRGGGRNVGGRVPNTKHQSLGALAFLKPNFRNTGFPKPNFRNTVVPKHITLGTLWFQKPNFRNTAVPKTQL